MTLSGKCWHYSVVKGIDKNYKRENVENKSHSHDGLVVEMEMFKLRIRDIKVGFVGFKALIIKMFGLQEIIQNSK